MYVYWLDSDRLRSFLPGSQRVNFPLNYLFIYLSVLNLHEHVPPVCHACPQPLTTSLKPTGHQWQPSNRSADKNVTQLRGPASRLGIRQVMICLKYCSSEHRTIPPMVRVNSFWSRCCQISNRGDLCLIPARCNQENNRWLCLTGEPRTCQRNRWKFINNTPDSKSSWGEFFQKEICNPLFHLSQKCIQMQRGVFCNQGRERPLRKTVLLRGCSFIAQRGFLICQACHFCATSINSGTAKNDCFQTGCQTKALPTVFHWSGQTDSITSSLKKDTAFK